MLYELLSAHSSLRRISEGGKHQDINKLTGQGMRHILEY